VRKDKVKRKSEILERRITLVLLTFLVLLTSLGVVFVSIASGDETSRNYINTVRAKTPQGLVNDGNPQRVVVREIIPRSKILEIISAIVTETGLL